MAWSSELSRFIVCESDTIETAMAQIEENQHRSVIVLNPTDVVVGTLSDGDLRKALLERRLMTTPVGRVMNPNYIGLLRDGMHRAPEIFATQHIFLIPIIDEAGKLLDILTAY